MSRPQDLLPPEQKESRLEDFIQGYESVLIAFSGGVDSAYLAYTAHRLLGEQALAVTAISPAVSQYQKELALEFAGRYGLRHELLYTREMDNPNYTSNPTTRCYHCKSELYTDLTGICQRRGFQVVFDGNNLDDQGDFRPGQKAAREKAVISPLTEVGLTKDEIRRLSRKWGLPTWNQPAMPCLASRLPYGVEVTDEKLSRVERAEELLRQLGFRNFRVRHHEDLARIEVAREEMQRILEPGRFEHINQAFKTLGYRYVTLDMQGFRSGSLNEVL